jgi:hypothetical protein
LLRQMVEPLGVWRAKRVAAAVAASVATIIVWPSLVGRHLGQRLSFS